MLKLYKNESPIEQAVQELEHFLNENEMSIIVVDTGLVIRWKGKEFSFVDTDEHREGLAGLPRIFDTQRIIDLL